MIRALPVALLLGAVLFPLVFTLPFPRHIMIMIFLYGALATAWNIIAGYCGQISLGQAVFFGIGAYTSSLLFKTIGLTPWVGMIAGAADRVPVDDEGLHDLAHRDGGDGEVVTAKTEDREPDDLRDDRGEDRARDHACPRRQPDGLEQQ